MNTPLVSFLNNALKAKELYKKDKDYVVIDGEVLIVDEFTGRMLHGRRYSEGMHQAIEAKEGVQIKDENQTLATITLQNYFRLYEKLAGMTGTAMTEANEFHQTYKLGVVPIPTNKPMIRADQPDLVYQTVQAKFEALVDDIVGRHEAGQPVLVGTTSVEKSELRVQDAQAAGRPARGPERQVPRARGGDHRAGRPQGRGHRRDEHGRPRHGHHARRQPRVHRRPRAAPARAVAGGHAGGLRGGLARGGGEGQAGGGRGARGGRRGGRPVRARHRAARVAPDRQPAPRPVRPAGRPRRVPVLPVARGRPDADVQRATRSRTSWSGSRRPPDVPIESKTVSRSIRSAQTQVEQQNFEIRKDLLKYDDVMNRQRQVVYDERREVLEGADLQEQIRSMIDEVIAELRGGRHRRGLPRGVGPRPAVARVPPALPGRDDPRRDASRRPAGSGRACRPSLITEVVQQDALAAYERREEELTPEVMRELERRVVLSVLDRKWREHLYEMDYLREGIALRGWAQRDPLVEYQREGYDMFNTMMDGIEEESVGDLFNLQVEVQESPIVEQAAGAVDGTRGAAGSGGRRHQRRRGRDGGRNRGRQHRRDRGAAWFGGRPCGPWARDSGSGRRGRRRGRRTLPRYPRAWPAAWTRPGARAGSSTPRPALTRPARRSCVPRRRAATAATSPGWGGTPRARAARERSSSSATATRVTGSAAQPRARPRVPARPRASRSSPGLAFQPGPGPRVPARASRSMIMGF